MDHRYVTPLQRAAETARHTLHATVHDLVREIGAVPSPCD